MSELVDNFWPQTIDGLASGAIYALIALGYTLVYGVLRLINFAHSEIFMIGTFGALAGTAITGLHPGDAAPSGLGALGVLLVASITAMAASGTAAVVLERVAYRPLRKRGSSRLAVLISAIGASFFISELFADPALPFGRDQVRFPSNITSNNPVFHLFGAAVMPDRIIVFVAALVMMFVLDRFVQTTRLGRGIRAVAQDPETATLMGVNIDRVVTLTFLLGGMMAGVAAVLYDVRFDSTSYRVGFLLGIRAFTAAVLGGIGNIRGALLGGLLLGLMEKYGGSVFGNQWQDVVAFVLLVLVLLFRPTGLLGESLGKARV